MLLFASLLLSGAGGGGASASGRLPLSGSATADVAVKAHGSGTLQVTDSATGKVKVAGAANDRLSLSGNAQGTVSGTALPTPPVTLDDIKAHLRVDTTDEDTLIDAYRLAAIAAIEAQTSKKLTQKTITQVIDGFPVCDKAIRLFQGPVTTITSIKYDDSNGVEQTLTSFRLVEGIVEQILPAYLDHWPSDAMRAPGSVRVTYVAGYDVVQPGDDLKLWHFSSDEMRPTLPAGSTFHADYFEAWDPATKAAWTAHCLDGHKNSSSGNLCNGHQIKHGWGPFYGGVATTINPHARVPLSSIPRP